MTGVDPADFQPSRGYMVAGLLTTPEYINRLNRLEQPVILTVKHAYITILSANCFGRHC